VKVLAWVVPDLALVAACVTLFYCLFLFQGYGKLFRDSDAGWHIRTGEAILSTGDLPRTDPYSFTRAGQPWFAWEWMTDVAAGAVDRAAGLSGVALFYAAAIAAAYGCGSGSIGRWRATSCWRAPWRPCCSRLATSIGWPGRT